MKLLRRLRYLLDRQRLDDELANDLEFHREMAARDKGMPLGNALLLREQSREAWGWMWIERLLQDLRYALRLLGKSPGFTIAAILMLAIGIGVNVAAFSFFDLMYLRALNVRDPDTLIRLHRRSPEAYSYVLPYPEMTFVNEHTTTLASVLGLNIGQLAGEAGSKVVRVHFVTPNFFTELGATPTLGGLIDPARGQAGDAQPVVVLSEPYWQSRFGADRSIVGKTIRLNDKLATIIGVASRQFSGLSLETPDLWAPVAQQPYFAAGSQLLTDFSADSSGMMVWGRMKPGVTPQIVEEELRSLVASLRTAHPKDIWDKEGLVAQPGGYASGMMIGGRRGTGSEDQSELVPAFGVAGTLTLLILAVACSNLGSLLMARGVAREREMSIRTAVGAGSGRLIRQLLTESVLLALLGTAAGLVLGSVVLRGLILLSAAPVWFNPAPDWRIAGFAVAVGFLSALLFGLTPALQIARQRHRQGFARQVLVAVQVAASCILLIVAGLLVRALDHALNTDPGFEYRQVVTIDPGLGGHGYTPERSRAYLDSFEGRLRAVPGVVSVSLALSPPLGRRSATVFLKRDGTIVRMELNEVDPGFLETMKIQIVRGRDFTKQDTHSLIVSDALARRMWPGEDPLGKVFKEFSDGSYTIIGVAATARMVRLEDADFSQIYSLTGNAELPGMTITARTLGTPESLAQAAGAIARTLDPAVIPQVTILRGEFREKLRAAERGALAVSLLGFVAQLLACLGIVGVVAFAVSQRTKEIGIRMALGAKPAHVIGSVLRQFTAPVILGMLAGVGCAAGLSHLLRQILYGVSNLDPVAYASAIGVFALTVALAAIWPARRALRIDPMNALRCD